MLTQLWQVLNKSIEALVTGSTNYTIRAVIDDGTGMSTLMLETLTSYLNSYGRGVEGDKSADY